MATRNISSSNNRREFLRQAGGVTFLALVSRAPGVWAAADTALPLFKALPYIQPGNNSALIEGRESQTIAWQTDKTEAAFTLEYGATKSYGSSASILRSERVAGMVKGKTEAESYAVPAGLQYAATLPNLNLSKRYFYRLRGNGKIIVEGEFTTRKKRGEKVRFVSFGDNANGSEGERAVAYQAYQAHPDFIMNTGDNVYGKGLNSEYIKNFFPVYNADKADIAVGAPLLRSVPFYSVIANHDVAHKGPNGAVADFDQAIDALGYYTNLYLPLNGPQKPTYRTPTLGAEASEKSFRQAAGPRFPRMANYSFDYGEIHFLCLDANTYIDPSDSALQKWIADDLKATDATWKFVVYHHPCFNVGEAHFEQQHMRVLSPIFEAAGVDFCLNGHEHVYQRSMPLRFRPTDTARVDPKFGGDRLIPGEFTCDRAFDGKSTTRPDGVVYITTGAGGASLYSPGFDHAPEKWLHDEDKRVAYVSRFVSSQHSFTVFDVTAHELTMTQIGEKGEVLDTIRVTKK
jgi:hypothetical protein